MAEPLVHALGAYLVHASSTSKPCVMTEAFCSVLYLTLATLNAIGLKHAVALLLSPKNSKGGEK